MRMTALRVSWLGLTLGAGACPDWRWRAKRSMAEPALGGFVEVVSVAERSFDIQVGGGKEHTLVVSMVSGRMSCRARAETVDSSSAALQTT